MLTIKDHILYQDGRRVNWKQSPNHGGVIVPEIAVIHYTGSNSLQGALSWLCHPRAKVSAHLVIAKTGLVWQLVPFNRKAWHAGVSSYDGRANVNDFSIGIENVGLGDDWFEAQIQANIDVLDALYPFYQIEDTVGHCDVAPGRKSDPGPRYPWDRIFPGWEK
jgi:N-acetylmuramoyl-L-alanine amidase